MKNKFYVTFGQNHPLHNGFVVIEAIDYNVATEHAFKIFGQYFSMIRSQGDIDANLKFFPAGKFGETLYA